MSDETPAKPENPNVGPRRTESEQLQAEDEYAEQDEQAESPGAARGADTDA
jgi:hypothetical protein